MWMPLLALTALAMLPAAYGQGAAPIATPYTCPEGTYDGEPDTQESANEEQGTGLCAKPFYLRTNPRLILNPNKARIALGEEYHVTCNHGFYLRDEDSALLRCLDDGTLTNRDIDCRRCLSSEWIPDFPLGKALVGYNYRKGDPFAKIDPGFKGRIFDARAKNRHGCDMRRLHPGITVTNELACTDRATVTVHRSYNSLSQSVEESTEASGGIQVGVEYELSAEAEVSASAGAAEVSASAGVSATIPPPFQRGWSESNFMRTAQNFFSESGGSVAVSKAECNVKNVELIGTSLPSFSEPFKNALERLNGHNYDSCQVQQNAFRTFIGNYGTHYFTKVNFGASISTYTEYSERTSSMLNDQQMEACSGQDMSIQFGPVLGLSNSEDNCNGEARASIDENSNSNMQRLKITKGSRPNEDTGSWAEGDFVPVPLQFNLAPIINLLTDSNLDENSGLSLDRPRLRQWLVPMYFNYCEVMGVSCQGGCNVHYCVECNEDGSCRQCQDGTDGIPSTMNEGYDHCEKQVCSKPENTNLVLANTNEPSPNARYAVGDDVIISCPRGYALTGASRMTCEGADQWSGEPIKCEAQVLCANGNYVDSSQENDGINDCGDCTDEMTRGDCQQLPHDSSAWSNGNFRGRSNPEHHCNHGAYVTSITWKEQHGYGLVDLKIQCSDTYVHHFTGNRGGFWNPSRLCSNGFRQVFGREQNGYGIVNVASFCARSTQALYSNSNFNGYRNPAFLHCPINQKIVGFETQEQRGYGIINFRIICA